METTDFAETVFAEAVLMETVGAELSSTSVGRNPASVFPAPVGAISSAERSSRAFSNSANWCARGDQPRAANHCWKRSGSSAAGSADVLRMRGGTASQVSRGGEFVEGWPLRLSPLAGRGRRAAELASLAYSVTGLSETIQSLPLKVEMNNVFIGV